MLFHVEVDWRYGVHSLIVEYVDSLYVSEDHVLVVDATEVVILNNPK